MDDQPKRFPDADPSLAYDVAKHRLDIQLASIDALDNKLAVGFSLGTAIMAVLLASLALGPSTEEDSAGLSAVSLALLSLTATAYIVQAYLFFEANLLFRSWSIGPATRDIWKMAETYRDHMGLLYWAAVESLDRSYEENAPRYEQKSTRIARGFARLAVQVVLGSALVIQSFYAT
jgi:hypothetical protein